MAIPTDQSPKRKPAGNGDSAIDAPDLADIPAKEIGAVTDWLLRFIDDSPNANSAGVRFVRIEEVDRDCNADDAVDVDPQDLGEHNKDLAGTYCCAKADRERIEALQDLILAAQHAIRHMVRM